MTVERDLWAVVPVKAFAQAKSRLAPQLSPEVRSALAWLIDPDRRIAQVYRGDGSIATLAPDGRLDGEDVVRGFSCAVTELFE